MNVGDIISYKVKHGLEHHARVGGSMTNDLGYKIIHLYNPYTGRYYGNIREDSICTTTNQNVIMLIREEKLEKLISDFNWEKRINEGILIKKYNDNRTINEIGRS